MDKYPKYISQEQQELFERYLLNEMDKAEQLAFLARLDANSLYKEEFDDFKRLFSAVEEAGLHKKMNEYHKTFESDPQKESLDKKMFPLRVQYGIAASLILLLSLGSIWYFNGRNNAEKLFEEFYSPDPGLPTVMGNTDDYDFYAAMVAYKHGDYDKAIEKWEALLKSRPQNDTLNYFLASAHLAIGNDEKAIRGFKKVLVTKNSIFIDNANLYLGLSYLRKERTSEAKKYLTRSELEIGQKILDKLPE